MESKAGMPDGAAPTYGGARPAAANPEKPAYMMDLRPYMSRFASLRTEGLSKWYPIWRDLSRFILPIRGFFEGMMPNWGTRIDHKIILSAAPMNSVRTLASGLQSGLTSPAKQWFRLEVDDDEAMKDDDTLSWLDEAAKKLRAAFQASGIYGAFYQMYEEVANFGTAAFILLEDFETVVRPRSFTIGEYFLGCGADGRVNAFARQFWMTAGQLVEEFGEANCSAMVVNENKKDESKETWHMVYHVIIPNKKRAPGLRDNRNMPFESVYWEANAQDNKKALRCTGFDEFPVIASRWDITTTADAYGKGPGWHALGDVKLLYKMMKRYLEALDKSVDPPMQADSATVVNTLPGGLTRTSSQHPDGGVKPAYQIKPDLPGILNGIDRLEKKIADTFYANLFMMIADAGKDMTAEEVFERRGEKLVMLGPVLHRLESEGINKAIERTFNVLLRAKALPPPPPAIAGRNIRVKYVSPLAQAQEMAETAVIEQFAKFIGGLAAVNPQVLDIANFDEMVREYGKRTGIPAKILNSPKILAALRQARAKQEQTAAGAQNAAAAAQTAKVLSDTKVGGGSALEALTGAGAGGQPPAGGVA
jgi:hypothetical protein